MVIQDMVKQYGRKKVSLGCLMKIDIDQQAYDIVDWMFLQEMLQQLGFQHLCFHC